MTDFDMAWSAATLLDFMVKLGFNSAIAYKLSAKHGGAMYLDDYVERMMNERFPRKT